MPTFKHPKHPGRYCTSCPCRSWPHAANPNKPNQPNSPWSPLSHQNFLIRRRFSPVAWPLISHQLSPGPIYASDLPRPSNHVACQPEAPRPRITVLRTGTWPMAPNTASCGDTKTPTSEWHSENSIAIVRSRRTYSYSSRLRPSPNQLTPFHDFITLCSSKAPMSTQSLWQHAIRDATGDRCHGSPDDLQALGPPVGSSSDGLTSNRSSVVLLSLYAQPCLFSRSWMALRNYYLNPRLSPLSPRFFHPSQPFPICKSLIVH